ncbi:MAG: RNA methyltransferase [Pirellulaceae bacterium]
MRPIEITDPTDPRIAKFVDVRKARSASNRGSASSTFIAEGHLVVGRLIESDYKVQSLLVQQGSQIPCNDKLPSDVSVFTLPSEMIDQVVGFDFHRGVLACGERQAITPSSKFSVKKAVGRVGLVLLGITEQENMGSILRTAAALGIQDICLGPGTIDPLSRRVIRVSMATVFKHRFFRIDDPAEQLREWSKQDIRTIASTLQDDSMPIADLRRDNRPTLLIIGNEATGIDLSVQNLTTDRVRIPMANGVDSLNAAVAAAILMYELTSAKD